jgi:hypothetical protein
MTKNDPVENDKWGNNEMRFLGNRAAAGLVASIYPVIVIIFPLDDDNEIIEPNVFAARMECSLCLLLLGRD